MHREEIGRAGAHHPAPAALAGPWMSSSARAAGVEVVWSRLSSAPLTLLFGCCCDTVTHCLENDHESETETHRLVSSPGLDRASRHDKILLLKPGISWHDKILLLKLSIFFSIVNFKASPGQRKD